jgi:hypothetical protein
VLHIYDISHLRVIYRGARGTSSEVGNRVSSEAKLEAEFPPKRSWKQDILRNEVGSRISIESSVSSDHTTRRHNLQVSMILVDIRYCLVGCDFCSRSLRNQVVTSQITIAWPIPKLSKPVIMSTGKYLPTFRKCIVLLFIDKALN